MKSPLKMPIGCWAIGAKVAYIYIRGEFYHVQKVLEAELAKAYEKGYVGRNILGSGFDCDIVIHRGAGAYEAGEETALIESLEGKRAQPRIKPPFPAVAGLYNCPTAVNNVETLCNLPVIVLNGAEWFASLGPEKNGGPKLFCVSGHVKRPGVYEASMHITLRELIFGDKYAGGIRDGRKLKAVIPGGSSVPILLPDQLDIPASFDGVARAGSMLGSAGIIVLDDSVCIVDAVWRLSKFFAHESCGQCTPCREGTRWLEMVLGAIERCEGTPLSPDLVLRMTKNMTGTALCALADAAVGPTRSLVTNLPEEVAEHLRLGRCPLPPQPYFSDGAGAPH